ncbi:MULTISPECIES: MFS transporter [Gulosibacter]|uniref:MFS transporter n=1 Tax=Gulosibacter TaxID=256818 RepID=UPI000F634B9F|nr:MULTISPECIES: MFS transporter [Gulosibacter]
MSTDTPNTHSLSLIPPRLPGIIFTLALVAYIVAVTQRSSLGVAGVDAIARFDASATALSTLAVMQVVVYAAAQIPVGMLLDRFGPSRLIISGAALMAVGQVIVAVAPSIEVAVVGRVLVGLGDAATFVSGLRIISAWFRPRKVPVMQQWLGNLGQLGQFISAVPFSTLLHLSEWTVAFLTTASLSVIVVVAAIAGLKDVPGSRFGGQPMSLAGAFSTLGGAFGRPGTRLGFWSHFTTQFPGNVFGLLWGYPLMVQGLGYAPQLASALLILPVVVGMFVGPVIGLLTARFPLRRSNLVIGIAITSAIFWSLLLLWPGQPPLWFYILVLVVTGAATTGSNIGFDFARTFNPSSSYGSASGIVNVGGFTASAIAFLTIGLGIDAVTGGAEPTWDAFRVAMWTFPVLTVIGIAALLHVRGKTRNWMAAEEGVVVAPLWRALARRMRRRGDTWE